MLRAHYGNFLMLKWPSRLLDPSSYNRIDDHCGAGVGNEGGSEELSDMKIVAQCPAVKIDDKE